MEITKTNLALTVNCKCGSCIAATMLWGGIDIDEDFMDTLATYANNGGTIELVDTRIKPVRMHGCTCNNLKIS